MTTHRRAWTQRAGVAVALIVGAVFALPASPAVAAPPTITNYSASPTTLEAGKATTVTYKLEFVGGGKADVEVTSNNSKLRCTGGCTQGKVDGPGPYTASFALASDFTSEANAAINIKATEVLLGNTQGDSTTETIRVTLIGKPKVQTVKEISGKVTNQSTGEPIPGALVIISDSGNHRYEVTSGSTGGFRFTGSTEKPITPGSIQIGAAKDDIQVAKTINAAAGQSLTVRLVLKVTAATPSATAEAEATTDPTTEETTEATESAQAAAPTGNDEESGGSGSLLFILVGGLLVALGVGAIVLLWMRRKETDAEDEDEAGAGGPAPRRRGAYAGADDATRMTNRAGAGADPTMVGRPSLADAPTMMHSRPLVEEFPDPYGAPLPPPQPQGPPQPPAYGQPGWAGNGYGGAPTQAGYGSGAAGYGNAPSSGSGYGGAPSSGSGYGGAPSSGSGYGGPAGSHGNSYGTAPSSGGGYGAPASRPEAEGYGTRDYGATGSQSGPGYGRPPGDRYDEPTGRYEGGGGGYGQTPQQPGSYGQPSGPGRGHGQDQQYGPDPRQGHGGGYGADAGYASDDGYAQHGYGSGPTSYDQSANGGYDQRGGYDRVPEPRDGGYDARGYDQGGYHDESAQDGGRRGAPPQPTRAERRSLDWLDD